MRKECKQVVDSLIGRLALQREAVCRSTVCCADGIQRRCRLCRAAVAAVKQEAENDVRSVLLQRCNQRIELCDHGRIEMRRKAFRCVGVLRIACRRRDIAVSDDRDHRVTDTERLRFSGKCTRYDKSLDGGRFGTYDRVFCKDLGIGHIRFTENAIAGTFPKRQNIFCTQTFSRRIRRDRKLRDFFNHLGRGRRFGFQNICGLMRM